MIAHLLKPSILAFRFILCCQAKNHHEQNNNWKHDQQGEAS